MSLDLPAPGVTFFEQQIVPYQLSKGVVIHASFKGEQDDRCCAVVGLRGVGVLVLGVGCWFLVFGFVVLIRVVCVCLRFNSSCSVFVWMRSFESQEQRDAQCPPFLPPTWHR